jgi:thioredoxin-related protein
MMAPILEELKEQYVGRMKVDFIDVWENPDEAKKYNVKIIPTQIFYDPAGKELFRHEGFFSKEDILGKWKELGYDLTESANSSVHLSQIERWEPAQVDDRPHEQVCYMCDGDNNTKTLVVVKTDKGDVRLCSPHCYFVMYSCLTEDKTDFESKVSVTDFSSGKSILLSDASFLIGTDQQGRPVIWAYADAEIAKQEQILAARYQVRSIPTQVFFDKTGQEVYRHVGFFSVEDIEKQLLRIGIQ